MKFTEEQLKKINTAKSAEELMALAKAEGIEMSEEEIKAKFAEMHSEGEIADEELDNVAGGCGEEEEHEVESEYRCNKGCRRDCIFWKPVDARVTGQTDCPYCGGLADPLCVYDKTTGDMVWF